jgi:hypothetical protein
MGLKKRILGASVGLMAIFACNTPSVPLPPPELPALRFPMLPTTPPGFVVLQGMPSQRHIRARFYTVNRSNGDGVITTAGDDGAFTTEPFAGAEGDYIQLYYDSELGERSEQLCVELRFDVPLISTRCP